jgi:two-component system, cell cycle sensor histidine kinase and response regulator CckA
MNGFAETALTQLGREAGAYDSVQHLIAAGERAAALVCQLLVFSRRQVMKPERLDVNVVVSDLLKLVRRIIGEHKRSASALPPRRGHRGANKDRPLT